MHNIESTLKAELDAHNKSSSSNDYKPILKKSPYSNEDSDSTSSEAIRSKNLREKLNSEFHHARSHRNYFNNNPNENYQNENFSSGSNNYEVMAMK